MKEVGNKFGKLLDVYMMQKIYDEPPTTGGASWLSPVEGPMREEPR
jgi:hypothetical protein